MTDGESEEQRRSFAYGNTKIENDLITRETIDRQLPTLLPRTGHSRINTLATRP